MTVSFCWFVLEKQIAMQKTLLAIALAAASTAWAQQPTEKPEGFLCCNMRSAGGWISDINYEVEGERIIPLGTLLKVTGYGFHRAHVLIDGKKHSIGNDYSRSLPLNVFIQRYVIPTNPQEKLAQFPPHIQTAIRNSKVTKGMTREQVIMSVGYPVASENPTLDANLWRFWLGSFSEYRVRFDANGLVDRIDADIDIEHTVIQP